ncbi:MULTISPECIES: hypothetical protein [Legionella]|uniref:U-box domain-containing protein n=1 Tax=Legionella steelei TaxID=947033 RepID=A0A0W0ZD16_9GAMM|nr:MULTISPECIES: hypothetical protein [Legionella]KTD66932.1 hypothetical protein Lste_3138 [Legionella steelei]MBN9227334.1 hypothetical protein [Legionella steelei]OJW13967.1 MAG: hypothetical protein BGO44_08390 [Legionella sp. 39-23]
MLLIIVQIPPRVRFNPFTTQADLFSFYHQVNNISKAHHTPYISFYNNSYQEERINHLKELSRILVLEMALNHRYEIPAHRNSFNAAVNRANFHFRNLETPIEVQRAPSPRASQRLVPDQGRVAAERPNTPFGHVPKPDTALQERAKKAMEKLGNDLPSECTDPISMEPLTDPIEINNRVYNRGTALNLLERGQFKDPFTRELIDPKTAKSGSYMLEAMEQHLEAKAGKEPALYVRHKQTNVHPLKDLIENWENLLNTAPKPH